MLTIEEAVEVLTGAVSPVSETEKVSLHDAAGRVLAADIVAPRDQPPFDRSPLDGYAVRGEDTIEASKDQPVRLRVIGKIYAGQTFAGKIEKDECVRIMTGAPIPEGANAIIKQEDTDYGEDRVSIYRGVEPWKNYCYAGEDYHKGEVLVPAGTVLFGNVIGVISGTGLMEVDVIREPAIRVISTGDEVVAPGQPLAPGKIYDSNQYLVAGRLRDLGFKRISSSHCADDAEEMCQLIKDACPDHDLIITTGGVSVGQKDFMHEVLDQLGAEKLFWKVSLKPGAPTLAFIYQDTLVICLTGNPYGVAVNFELLVRPVLARLTGNPRLISKKIRAILENDSPKHGGLRRFLRGSVFEKEFAETEQAFTERKEGDAGRVVRTVRILDGNQTAGSLSNMVYCNCLVEIDPIGTGKKGELVWVYPL